MQAAALALFFLIPVLIGLIGTIWYATLWMHEHVLTWRDRERTPYIPGRVWWDDRYGGTDADPLRHVDGHELPAVPPPFDPGTPAHLSIHPGYRR